MAEDDESRISIPPGYWIIVVLFFGALAVSFVYTTLPKHQHGADTFGYVGADKCKECHEKQFRDWRKPGWPAVSKCCGRVWPRRRNG